MEHDDYRLAALETWESVAPGWERWREEREAVVKPVTEWLLSALAPRTGDTIIELAAGPGDTGFAALSLIGDDGCLISTDLTPGMVEVARRRSEELDLRNVEHRVMDAEQIALPDDAVDGVLCRFGYMLMPDRRRACAETRRVLRPGGRLALAVWCAGDRNPWISIAAGILVERGHVPLPEPDAPGIFALADEEELRALLEESGFAVQRTEDVPVRFVYRDVDAYIDQVKDTGGTFATVWRDLPEEERDEILLALEVAFEPFTVDGSYELPGVTLCAVAG